MVAKEKLDIEGLLAKFSLLSPYYIKLFSMLVFAGVTNIFSSLNYIFAATDTNYRCEYANCETSSLPLLLNASAYDNGCHRFPYRSDNGNCTLDNINLNEKMACDAWLYEDPNSFVSEFNLGCEDWKRTLVGTVHSFGYMVGLLIMGPLADKIGRKKLIIITGITAALTGLSRSIVTSYWTYITLELIEALFGDTYSSSFMLGVEMVTKENRVSFITLMTASTSIAGILMALIAWAVPYWRNFLRAVYAPSLLFVLYTFLLDESLRWLLITGQKEKANDIIKGAAKLNNIALTEDDLDGIECEKGGNDTNWISLLKMTVGSKKLLLRFLACICMWITALFNKYTLLINSVELEGNKYVNFALTTFSELPASFALAFLLRRYKRKTPLIFSFLLTGVFCIGQSFVPKGHITISTSLFLIGKFMATISYAIVYLYTSELFPTYTRNTMHALCSSLGRTATIIAPQTPLLKRYFYGLPSVLVGGLSLITGLVVISMPETSEDVLPDTVKQAEHVGDTENCKETEDTRV